MHEVTKLLSRKHEIFVEELGFKINSYDYSSEFGGSSYIIYVKDSLAVIVTKSRDGINYDFGEAHSLKKHNWYSLDIIRHYISGLEEYRKLKNVNPITFITDNIDELEHIFSEDVKDEIHAKLKEIEKKRAKKLFK